jgi:hypothetical protein
MKGFPLLIDPKDTNFPLPDGYVTFLNQEISKKFDGNEAVLPAHLGPIFPFKCSPFLALRKLCEANGCIVVYHGFYEHGKHPYPEGSIVFRLK